jgi:hypothetical protein
LTFASRGFVVQRADCTRPVWLARSSVRSSNGIWNVDRIQARDFHVEDFPVCGVSEGLFHPITHNFAKDGLQIKVLDFTKFWAADDISQLETPFVCHYVGALDQASDASRRCARIMQSSLHPHT